MTSSHYKKDDLTIKPSIMKALHVTLKVACATLLLFVFTSFKPVKSHTTQKDASTKWDPYYYWYLDGGTVYDDWTSVNNEVARLEYEYGVYVDEDPIDGTLIASGYAIKGYPHLVYASVFLYSH